MAEIRYNHCLKISHSQNEIQNLSTCIGIYREISKFSTQITDKKEGREKEKTSEQVILQMKYVQIKQGS